MSNWVFFSDSGFFCYRSKQLSLALNLKGHGEYYWERCENETRLSGGIPLWIEMEAKKIMPSIPFTADLFVVLPSYPKIARLFLRRLNGFYSKAVNAPHEAGFNFYYTVNRRIYFSSGLNNFDVVESEGSAKIFGKPRVANLFKHKILRALKNSKVNSTDYLNSEIISDQSIKISESALIIQERLNNVGHVDKSFFNFRTFKKVNVWYVEGGVIFQEQESNKFFGISLGEFRLVNKRRKKSGSGKLIIWTFEILNQSRTKKVSLMSADSFSELKIKIGYEN